jgi:hypothetical protein
MDARTIGVASDTTPGADLGAEARALITPLLRTHTAMLYYASVRDTLVAWLLTPAGTLRIFALGALTTNELGTLVATLRDGLGADAARLRMARSAEQERGPTRGLGTGGATADRAQAALRAFSARLLPKDLASIVAAGSEVVIVPYGALGLVPFAALPVPGDTMPLGVRYAIRYAPSLRALDRRDTSASESSRALVVGDPAMPIVPLADGRRAQLAPLPGAAAEARWVASHLGTTMLTGRAATETAVRRQLPRAHLVHLATHGLAFGSDARVRDSYVALAPDSLNDGRLTLGEIADDPGLSLSADLVVLSACQTGLGDLKQAEGTVGFQRALLARGARSVLVSLWSVDDRATSLLMQRFYTHWRGLDGHPPMNKAESLRRAQQELRSWRPKRGAPPPFAAPQYWAAFQLVGSS